MTITAKVIEHSVNKSNSEIISVELKYPRFIHSEVLTHRVFSRSASSSRAIPVSRLIQDIIDDTAMPIHWGKNQPGMQAKEECNNLVGTTQFDGVQNTREEKWNQARDRVIEIAREYARAGYHKQIVNRLLEPFSHINVIITSTDWDNFFELRDHEDAQPEFKKLARKIKKVMAASTPTLLEEGEWHLPYIHSTEKIKYTKSTQLRMSTARCARVSYLTHDNKYPDPEKDIALYEKLVGMRPLHASPAEHQATPNYDEHFKIYGESNFNHHWLQHRKILEREIWTNG